MPEVMPPQSFVVLLAAFADGFTAPSYANFCRIVAGSRHISVFHRFFARSRWALDELGHVVFRLALT
jgi:hypothetical protein